MENDVSNDEVLGQMLFERAKTEYPYLADKDVGFTYTPNKGRGYLEFYAPDEPGSEDFPRPKELPMGKVGIQVFNPKTRTTDILSDYVSHYGVENDPKLKSNYDSFISSLNPEQNKRLQEQYAFYQKDPEYKETRPYEEWLKASGYPGYFRGYTFDQWPAEFNQKAYTKEQIDLLNQVRQYLGIK